jgi:hypothetical protein
MCGLDVHLLRLARTPALVGPPGPLPTYRPAVSAFVSQVCTVTPYKLFLYLLRVDDKAFVSSSPRGMST